MFFKKLQRMIIYSKSFPIKDHKALQLIKLIKRIKLVKNSFIKTFTFLLSRDSHDFELQSTQVAMRGLKRGLGTLPMWKIKSPPTPPNIHLNKGAPQPVNFITLSGIFYFLEREALLLTVGGFPDMLVQSWGLHLPPMKHLQAKMLQEVLGEQQPSLGLWCIPWPMSN